MEPDALFPVGATKMQQRIESQCSRDESRADTVESPYFPSDSKTRYRKLQALSDNASTLDLLAAPHVCFKKGRSDYGRQRAVCNRTRSEFDAA